LCGIHDEGIGELDAICDQRSSCRSTRSPRTRVDVEPGAGLVGALGEPAHRIDGGEGRRADRRDDGGGFAQLVAVDLHPLLLVGGHLAQLHPEHPRVLLHRRMRVLGQTTTLRPVT
jgi:hypothetical protein